MYDGPVVQLALTHCPDLHATKLDGLEATHRNGPDHEKGWTREVMNSTKPRLVPSTDQGVHRLMSHHAPSAFRLLHWRLA